MKGDARSKVTSPGDHPGKTVLHSLELEHVPNCDTMQQGVAVVKPTEHKGRCQALGLVQVQMFSDSAQVTDGRWMKKMKAKVIKASTKNNPPSTHEDTNAYKVLQYKVCPCCSLHFLEQSTS